MFAFCATCCEPEMYLCFPPSMLNHDLLKSDFSILTRPGVGGCNHSGIKTINDKGFELCSSKKSIRSAKRSITSSVNGGLHSNEPLFI